MLQSAGKGCSACHSLACSRKAAVQPALLLSSCHQRGKVLICVRGVQTSVPQVVAHALKALQSRRQSMVPCRGCLSAAAALIPTWSSSRRREHAQTEHALLCVACSHCFHLSRTEP